MINTSFAAFALAASMAMPHIGSPIHFHPKSAPDTRVNVTLVNNTQSFRDVKIAGKSYELFSHQVIDIKAPAGTVIFADSRSPEHRRGDVIASITPEMNQTTLNLR